MKIAGRKKEDDASWYVDFPRKFRNREEFFSLVAQIAKLHDGAGFKCKFPPDVALSNDVLLVRKGVSIEVKSGVNLKLKQENAVKTVLPHVSWGHNSFASCDWKMSFEALPGLQVTLYRRRGRPRNDLLRAQVRGDWEAGKSYSEIARARKINPEVARSYRDPGRTRRSKTSGN